MSVAAIDTTEALPVTTLLVVLENPITLPEVKPYPIVAANPTVPSQILLTAVQMLLPWNVSP